MIELSFFIIDIREGNDKKQLTFHLYWFKIYIKAFRGGTVDKLKKVNMKKRAAGILMPISALPGEYGIGNFGKGAYEFVDFLAATGQKYWQVLPLNPTSFGDSPYQSPASASGNPYFIDPEGLAEDGLLTPSEVVNVREAATRVKYGELFDERYKLLRLAFSRFSPDEDYFAFCNKCASWIDDYALFMALKVHYNYAPFISWCPEHKNYALAKRSSEGLVGECDFWRFVQYEFRKQWDRLHKYAKKKGIAIIGDMPIYVAHDSMDVWRAPEEFLLDVNYEPTEVAGCPPDAYSETGQRWGNPIYNWEKMKKDGFSWWQKRVGAAFALYDVLRIDHFRGFASYYAIPAEEETGKSGTWHTAPGKELFDAIESAYPCGEIIAEDLGFITDDVRELLEYTGFPGMKVIQFAFYGKDSEYLPRTYTTDNCIVYTSTHDSDCTRTWFETLPKSACRIFKKECKRYGGKSAVTACIELAMNSRARLAVICMQDYLELSSEEGRMNVPSTAEGNWSWRLSPDYDTQKLRRKILKFTKNSKR